MNSVKMGMKFMATKSSKRKAFNFCLNNKCFHAFSYIIRMYNENLLSKTTNKVKYYFRNYNKN